MESERDDPENAVGCCSTEQGGQPCTASLSGRDVWGLGHQEEIQSDRRRGSQRVDMRAVQLRFGLRTVHLFLLDAHEDRRAYLPGCHFAAPVPTSCAVQSATGPSLFLKKNNEK